jgi:hypothetical protein
MLRVTQSSQDATGATWKLEGKLVQPWVDEVRHLFNNGEPAPHPRLDLSSLTYVDEAGAELLRQLLGQGLEIESCSPYVAELLHCGRDQNRQKARQCPP